MAHAELDRERGPTPRDALEELAPQAVAILRVDRVERVAAEQLRRRTPDQGRERRARVEVVAGRIEHRHRVERALGDGLEAILDDTQRLLGLPASAPLTGFAETAFDRRGEAAEPVLADEVVGAGAHRRDGELLADLTRHQDDLGVEGGGAENGQRLGPAEAGHLPVAGDQVPGLPQCRAQRRRRVDAAAGDAIAGAPELLGDQQGVVLAVLDEKDA